MKTSYRHCKECNRLHDTADWPHPVETAPEPAYVPGQNYDEYLMGPKSGTFRRCKACGDLHDIYNWPANHWEEPPPRSDLASPAFISDNLESIGGLNGLQCQASGKWFTSKARMRQEYKARGVIEVGTDSQRFTPAAKVKPKPDKKAIKEAIAKAHNVVFNEGGTVENFVRRRKAKDVGPFGRIAAGK